jgi:4'-phosphopantetheinyl transferase
MNLTLASVEVWRVRTTIRDTRPLLEILSADERERAARLFDGARRARFVLARAALRHLLCGYLGGDPADLELRYSAAGKPYVARGDGAGLRFSVTHAGDLALLAFASGRDVGIDIERARPPRRVARIAARLFDVPTQRLLETLAPAERTLAFHHAWTQREAYVKAVGGTIFGTHDPLPFRWPRPDRDVYQPPGDGAWTIAALRPADGYIGTLVIEGEAGPIIEREHDPVIGR